MYNFCLFRDILLKRTQKLFLLSDQSPLKLETIGIRNCPFESNRNRNSSEHSGKEFRYKGLFVKILH